MTTSEIINPNFEEKITSALKAVAQFTALHLIRIRRHPRKRSLLQFQSSVMKWF